MSDRALFGAIFVAGVVTAVVAGLELGLVELRPPGPQRAPARCGRQRGGEAGAGVVAAGRRGWASRGRAARGADRRG